MQEVVAGRIATCTTAGLTDGTRCTVCGEVMNAQEETAKLAHTLETIPGKAATCSATGLTDGARCTVCGEVVTPQKIIEKLPHTPEMIYGIYPMCFRDGMTDGSVCSVCGEILEPCQVIPALAHKPGSLAGTPATCTEEGWTDGIACQICGHVMKAKEKIAKLPHTPAAAVKVKNPAAPVLDANGNLVNTPSQPGYCYDMVTKCKNCDVVLSLLRYPHTPGASTVETDSNGVKWKVVTCAQCGGIISRTKQ